MERQIVYITGYPRSGNTWLGRLLADVLGCEYNSFDGEQGDWPGERTPAPYLIRKTHALETPDNERTIFIYRDPRAVAVSLMFYCGFRDLIAAIDAMSIGIDRLGVGGYDQFMATWWNTGKAASEIRYYALHTRPSEALRGIIERVIHADYAEEVYLRAIARQGIQQAQRRYQDTHHLRQGKVGDWRNHFTREAGRLMQERYGSLMRRQGYIDRSDWWESLPA